MSLLDTKIRMSTMQAIIRFYWQLCRFKAGPEQTPTASVFVAITLLVYCVVNLSVWSAVGDASLLQSTINMLLMTGAWMTVVLLVLCFKSKSSRFKQTSAALLGSDALISCVSLPVLLFAVSLDETSAAVGGIKVMLLVVMVWDILVKGFIYHRSMGLSVFQGNLFSFSLAFGLMLLGQQLQKSL